MRTGREQDCAGEERGVRQFVTEFLAILWEALDDPSVRD